MCCMWGEGAPDPCMHNCPISLPPALCSLWWNGLYSTLPLLPFVTFLLQPQPQQRGGQYGCRGLGTWVIGELKAADAAIMGYRTMYWTHSVKEVICTRNHVGPMEEGRLFGLGFICVKVLKDDAN